MRRAFATAMIVGVFSLGLAGCGEESQMKSKETVSSPGGTTTTTNTNSVKSTGENPPPNSAGETGKTGVPK